MRHSRPWAVRDSNRAFHGRAHGKRCAPAGDHLEDLVDWWQRGGGRWTRPGPARYEAIGPEPIRLALDAVAGPGVNRLAECLVEGATIVNYGMLSTEACVLSPEQTIFRNIQLRGFWLAKLLSRMPQSKRVELLNSWCRWPRAANCTWMSIRFILWRRFKRRCNARNRVAAMARSW